MEKNLIVFSENGKEFNFVFANGKESLPVYSKTEGFGAIVKLARKKKITIDEFNEMRNQIMGAENLPMDEKSEEESIIDFDRLFSGPGGRLFEMMTIASFFNSLTKPEEPVEVACLRMCKCGGNHAGIYFKDGCTTPFDSKEMGFVAIEILKEEEFISPEEEEEKLKKEIEESSLS